MIEEIRNKPRNYRKRMAFGITFLLGVAIASFWLVIMNHQFKQAMNFDDEADVTLAQSFKETLPPIKQRESVKTELNKTNNTRADKEAVGDKENNNEEETEEKHSLKEGLKRFFDMF